MSPSPRSPTLASLATAPGSQTTAPTETHASPAKRGVRAQNWSDACVSSLQQ